MIILVLMDVCTNTINRLTTETVLKQVTIALVFVIIVAGVCNPDALNAFANMLIAFSDKQMHMVSH